MVKVYTSQRDRAPARQGLGSRPRLQRPARAGCRRSRTAASRTGCRRTVGCIRNFNLQGRRQRSASSCSRSRTTSTACTYSILDSPMGVHELRRDAQADAGHRRRPHLRRVDRRVRVRARARADARRSGRSGRVPGGVRQPQAPARHALSARLVVPKVIRSTIIDAPIEAVWAVLRDFNAPRPLAPDRRGEPHRGRAGARTRSARSATSGCRNGAQLREQLLELDDREPLVHLLHPRLADPADRLRRHSHAQARHRRQPHVLGLALAVRDAARPRGAARAHGRRGGVRRRASRRSARSSRAGAARRPPPLRAGRRAAARPRDDGRARPS